MDAESPLSSSVYVMLLCLLGLLMGAALALLFIPYARWVDRKQDQFHGVRRLRFGLFMFGVALPLAILPAYFSGVTPGLPSDVTEGELYLLVYIGGYIATLAVIRYRSRRRPRSPRRP